ncbi:MAG TPA: PAS domain-containing protein [Dongiaceae bacterium]|nr:PAS domain-containing protein [Dongiaceae bacterium]
MDRAELRDLAATWRGWAKGRALPLRDRFDPVDFPKLLPWIVLMEILPEAPELDARIRYVGSEIVHYFSSANITGTTLSDLGPIYWDRWADVGRQVRQARGPLCFQGAPFLVGKAHVNFEMLVLPLSKTGEGVDFLILALSRL